MLIRASFAFLLAPSLLACGSDAASPPVVPAHVASAELEACAAASLGRADTIDDLTAQLAALPTRSVPCLVAALPRPFGLVASTSSLSAQPAEGAQNPRIFVMLPALVITLVARGAGSTQVELGQWVTPTRTLKGELKLTSTSPLDDNSPFAHIVFGDNQTMCAQCHRHEERSDEGVARFVSDALRPDPATLLRFDALGELHAACVDAADGSARCAMIHALFDFGEVTSARFSPELKLMGAL